MNKKLFNLIKISLGIVILSILFYKLGIGDIIDTLKAMKFWLLIPIYSIIFISLFLTTVGIIVLIKPLGEKIGFWKLYRYLAISWSTGLFFPGKVGELTLLYFFKKHKISIGQGSGIWLMDKIISLFVVSILAVIGFLIFFGKNNTLILIISLLILFFLIFTFIFSDRLRGLVRKIILRKYARYFKGFSKLLFLYFKKYKKKLLINMFITITRTVVDSLAIFLIFLSFDSAAPFFFLLIIWAMEVIISLIPITINGLGIKQGVSAYLYSLIGIIFPVIGARYVISILVQYTAGLGIILTTKKKTI